MRNLFLVVLVILGSLTTAAAGTNEVQITGKVVSAFTESVPFPCTPSSRQVVKIMTRSTSPINVVGIVGNPGAAQPQYPFTAPDLSTVAPLTCVSILARAVQGCPEELGKIVAYQTWVIDPYYCSCAADPGFC